MGYKKRHRLVTLFSSFKTDHKNKKKSMNIKYRCSLKVVTS